jgi:hypothetical protein
MLGAPLAERKLASLEVGVRMRIPCVCSDDTKITVTSRVLSPRDEIRLEQRE